jgi:hypothetical protein
MNGVWSGIDQLEDMIRTACARQEEWPARIAAGICAALDFAAAYPERARALAIDSRITDFENGYLPMVEQFSTLLAAEVPPDRTVLASTEQALVGGIVTVVADHLRSGRADRLPQLAPELVHLTLLPYLGFAEAKRWAESVESPGTAAESAEESGM